MKKTKLFAALCLAAALACGLMLGACSSEADPAEPIKTDLATQFDPFKNLDETTINDLATSIDSELDFANYGIDGVAYIQSMLSGFDYAISDVTVSEDGKSATAIVNLTCKSFTDASARASELADEFAASGAMADMTMDEMNKKIGEILMQAMGEVETKTTECTFNYTFADGAWTIGDGADQEIYKAFFA